MTFRMRGHEEASGTKYVPQELFTAWEKKDPVTNYEQWLLSTGVLSDAEMNAARKRHQGRDRRSGGSGLQ